MSEEIKEKERLIAVVVADTFSKFFWPITQDCAKAEIPLCNFPIIDYTIELLTRSGIKNILVFCSVHARRIKSYVQQQKYKHVKFTYMSNTNCKNIGDVLRALDNRGILTGDFVLVQGDVVGNVKLDNAIQFHKQQREQDKEFIMTQVFKSLPVNNRLRSYDDQNIVILRNNQILQYDFIGDRKHARFNSNVKFKDLAEYDVRYDLLDTGISICSLEVLHYFSDNFDWANIRDYLLKDMLTHEIYTDKFAAYIVPQHEYVARVHNPRIYDAVSRDILNRWLHPIVLETNLLAPMSNSNYKCSRSNMYKENNVKIPHQCIIQPPCAIGRDTKFADNCVIRESVIGRQCNVGESSEIFGSYIWDNVIIGSNVKIFKALISNNARIGDGCIIEPGVVIGQNVVVKNGTVVPKRTRLSVYTQIDGSLQSTQGQNETEWGNAYQYSYQDDPELSVQYRNSEQFYTENIDDRQIWLDQDLDSLTDSSSEESQGPQGPTMTNEQFIDEIQHLVYDLIQREEIIETFLIEINSLKFSQVQSFKNCVIGIIKAVIQSAGDNIQKQFSTWGELFKIYAQSDEEKVDILERLEVFLLDTDHQNKFHLIVKALYEEEVVEDSNILEWHQSCTSEFLRNLMNPFIEWLQEEEDEEEDDEEDED